MCDGTLRTHRPLVEPACWKVLLFTCPCMAAQRSCVDSVRSGFLTGVGRGSSVSLKPRIRLSPRAHHSRPIPASTSSRHLTHPRPPGPGAAQTLPINMM
eukprot:6059417-Heterocapsa_arctica.AAC.1